MGSNLNKSKHTRNALAIVWLPIAMVGISLIVYLSAVAVTTLRTSDAPKQAILVMPANVARVSEYSNLESNLGGALVVKFADEPGIQALLQTMARSTKSAPPPPPACCHRFSE